MHFTQQPDTPQLSSSGPLLVHFLCMQVTIQAGWGDILPQYKCSTLWCIIRSYLITGLDCGLDYWTGLMDWVTGLNLFISHDLHPIKYCKFGYNKCTSSSQCMLGNVHECTMHKLHGQMCIMNSWCTRSELRAPSDNSKPAKEHQNY